MRPVLVTKSSGKELIYEVMVKVGDINGVKGLYIFDTKVFGAGGQIGHARDIYIHVEYGKP